MALPIVRLMLFFTQDILEIYIAKQEVPLQWTPNI